MLNHYTLINLRSISQSLGAVLIIHAAMYEVGLRLLVKLDTLTRFGFHDNCFKLRTGVTTTTTIVVVRTQYCNDTLFGFGEFGNFQTAFYIDRKSTRLNSSHANISYAVFCLKK